MDSTIFKITEGDVKSALDDLGIELDTDKFEEVCHFVADMYDNHAPNDIADAIMDFFDYQGRTSVL